MKRLLALLLFSLSVCAQTEDHNAGVMHRGASHEGMGFSQTTTTHHFILTRDGGIVQVTANDPKDTDQIGMIQMHMKHIAQMFSEGDFSIPHFVHDQTPPGVPTMRKLQGAIRYAAEMMETGATVKITADTPEGISAVHDFLRFQIADHKTGDPVTVQSSN